LNYIFNLFSGLANLAVGKLQAALIDLEEAVNKAENAN